MAKIISISKAKMKLLELAREAEELGESFILVRDSVPVGAFIPFEEYEALLETLDILETEPRILSRLKKTEREMAKGNFKIWKPERISKKSKKREKKDKKSLAA